MKAIVKLLMVILIGTLITSCSQRIVGTWMVVKSETKTPGQQGVSLTNIGTITFNSDGTGEKQFDYSVLGITQNDTLPFKWTVSDKFVTIKSQNSELAKTWVIMSNKIKTQNWVSTDGKNQVQILNLKKKKLEN